MHNNKKNVHNLDYIVIFAQAMRECTLSEEKVIQVLDKANEIIKLELENEQESI